MKLSYIMIAVGLGLMLTANVMESYKLHLLTKYTIALDAGMKLDRRMIAALEDHARIVERYINQQAIKEGR